MAYKVDAECSNCGWEGSLIIEDGELVNRQDCSICYCKTIIRKDGAIAHQVKEEAET